MKELFFKSNGVRNNAKTENALDLVLNVQILRQMDPEKKLKVNGTHRCELERVRITIKCKIWRFGILHNKGTSRLAKVSCNYGIVIFQLSRTSSSNSKRPKSKIRVLDSTSLASYNHSSIRSISLVLKIKHVLLSICIRVSYNFGTACTELLHSPW